MFGYRTAIRRSSSAAIRKYSQTDIQLQRQATTTIPKHQKKRCHPEPFLSHANNPTHNLKTKRGIKREKDLAELLRRAKGHA
jgi:hypothetical protein